MCCVDKLRSFARGLKQAWLELEKIVPRCMVSRYGRFISSLHIFFILKRSLEFVKDSDGTDNKGQCLLFNVTPSPAG